MDNGYFGYPLRIEVYLYLKYYPVHIQLRAG